LDEFKRSNLEDGCREFILHTRSFMSVVVEEELTEGTVNGV
jgi:hypothetical protein